MVSPSRIFAWTAVVLLGCQKPNFDEVESGVDTRIDAVIWLSAGYLDFLIATGGVVVDSQGERWELSDHTLRRFEYECCDRIWVVGDQGYVAYTDVAVDLKPVPIEWVPLSTGTQADLYAIVPAEERAVVVGDDIVLVGIEEQDGTWSWTQPQPPAGGWGKLRGVAWTGGEMPYYLAVGLAGRALVSTPGGDSWSVVPLSTDVDLQFICNDLAVGSALSRASWTGETWVVHTSDSSVDYVGLSCVGTDYTYALTSDRWIMDLSGGEPEPVLRIPWQPRAFDPWGIYIAGDNGHLATWRPVLPVE